jgi:hypothetical protein
MGYVDLLLGEINAQYIFIAASLEVVNEAPIATRQVKHFDAL